MLIKYDMFCVRIADLGPTVQLDPDEENGVVGEALKSGRAQYVSADLRVKSQVLEACRGAEVVFHMAAPDSSINNHQLHYSVNVQAVKNKKLSIMVVLILGAAYFSLIATGYTTVTAASTLLLAASVILFIIGNLA
ncbi:UNVERIFIED_CONTAM: 3beta-hydroxysteroid-dehydrogenase/decarboxylase isoform 2 [Sesamum radiatum]|uniref:3beta-hydroxysteroid-dehydrogenase/decarboxylase isoform 2 n=1 Tax=Sesamum radiatum TaxID=300843 RepID=A0AAW2JRQ4_SESRA